MKSWSFHVFMFLVLIYAINGLLVAESITYLLNGFYMSHVQRSWNGRWSGRRETEFALLLVEDMNGTLVLFFLCV